MPFVLQYLGSAPPSLTRLSPTQSSLLVLFLEVVILTNQNLSACASSLYLTQLIDDHDQIEAVIIAANVKFQGLVFQGGINLFRMSAIKFSWIISAQVRQWKTCTHSIDLEVTCLSNPRMCTNQSFTTKSPLTSLNAQPLSYFSFEPAP